jgi:hypothetical protein
MGHFGFYYARWVQNTDMIGCIFAIQVSQGKLTTGVILDPRVTKVQNSEE